MQFFYLSNMAQISEMGKKKDVSLSFPNFFFFVILVEW